jgi:REP element-mobilizing transposase RayT
MPLLQYSGFPEIVLKEIDVARKMYHIALFGFVIMPEHVHLVLFPQSAI